MKKKIAVVLMVTLIFTFCSGKNRDKYPYQDASLSVGKRVSDLVGRMTVEEKIQQLDMYWGKEVAIMDGHDASAYSKENTLKSMGTIGIGSVHDLYPVSAEISNKIQKYAVEKTRLGIPVLFIEEGLHGYCGGGSTMFPAPIQLAAAWDTSLVYKIGRIMATETRSRGVNMLLGPVLCIPRDPRWGRVEETYGEDPYLAALNGVAMIKGLQGKNLISDNTVVAEPKHFAVHGIPEAGSNKSPVNVGERDARSSFLYVFEKAVREGGALGIMAAYHELDGIPMVVNKWLLTDVLRKEWGFNGFVLSDLGAIEMAMNQHKIAVDTSDVLAQTFNAGMNMQFYDFGHPAYKRGIMKALETKALSQEDMDKAVAGVLRVKFLMGLFENPYIDTTLSAKVYHTTENQDLALIAAQQSICLLKNDKGVLPIKPNNQNVAVLGKLAIGTYLGGYSRIGKAISILDGLKMRADNSLKISYESGYDSIGSSKNADLLKRAVDLAKKSDIVIVTLGEDTKIVGENKDRANLDLDENQMNLIKAVHQTGKPIVAILSNGRPLILSWVAENIPAIVETWFSGEKGGLAIADVILGNVNPSGKLPITFPRSIGQAPLYYYHKPTSTHVYVDEETTPLFSFGHGLSYTTFKYSDLRISPEKITPDGSATIKVIVENTGKEEGTEVVQLYIRDEISSVTTPILALKGFDRISLKPGESGTVTFKVEPEQLSLWNRKMKRVVEPGTFKIMVGSSSVDIRQNGRLLVIEK